MVGPGGLEPLTSSVSRKLQATGTRRINRLGLRLSATVGFIGQCWLAFVQRFVRRAGLAFSYSLRVPLRSVDACLRAGPFIEEPQFFPFAPTRTCAPFFRRLETQTTFHLDRTVRRMNRYRCSAAWGTVADFFLEGCRIRFGGLVR